MEGDIARKNGCLVGENTNKGHQKNGCLVGENTNKGWGKNIWEETLGRKKILFATKPRVKD